MTLYGSENKTWTEDKNIERELAFFNYGEENS